jgi:hypothetical protein
MMITQTTTIEIDNTTAALLQSKAAAQGVSLDTLLRQLAESANGAAPKTTEAAAQASVDEFMAAMEALAEDTDHIPPSGLSYTREDIYFDHD